VPEVVTVMELVVAPVLHNRAPVNPLAVNSELPQLLVTLTVGATTEPFEGAAVMLVGALVQPLTASVTE
jgi:hypothetical protein